MVFWGSFIFLVLVWVLNLSQYLVVAAFVCYIAISSYYVRNIRVGLALGAILAFCIQTGKTYEFLMLAPGMVSPERFPQGYSMSLTITINEIVAVALAGFIINGIITKQYRYINVIMLDWLVLGFFFWIWVAALFGSNMPETSMLYAALSLSTLITYAFFRLHADIIRKHKHLIIATIAAILLFESTVALVQFANGSPLAKSIESQKHLEVFGGGATDEINFVFRPLGTFGHANYLAAFIALTAPIVFAFGILKRKKIYFVVYMLSLLTSVLTLSRSGWAALAPHIVLFYSNLVTTFSQILSKVNRVVKIAVLTGALALCSTVVFPRLIKGLDINLSDINNGLGVRVSQMENATKLISLHPLFGVGLGMNVVGGYAIEPNGVMWDFPSPVHNIFALILVENGVPAFTLYVLIIGYMLLYQFRLMNGRNGEKQVMAKGLFAGIVGACIIGLVQPYDFLGLILLLSLLYIQ